MSAITFLSIDVELVKDQPLEQAILECIQLSCNSKKIVNLIDGDSVFTIDTKKFIEEIILESSV